jgi:hypothetical protein
VVIIRVSSSWLEANPLFANNAAASTIQIGINTSNGLIPLDNYDPTYLRSGAGSLVSVRPGEDLLIENEIFYVTVQSEKNGVAPSFLNQLLQLVSKGVLEVHQDNGDALTLSEILDYSVPT